MTRAEVEKNTITFLRTADGTRPDLRVVETDGCRVVVKDFSRSDKLFRLLIGPILIRRERGALIRLKGILGVPQVLETIDRHAFVMEHVDGVALKDYKDPLPKGFFDKLTEVTTLIHERGIAHCDMRSSGNVMVTKNGDPKVVDFAACVIQGNGLNPLVNFVFQQFVDADLHAILMLKRRHAPDTLRPEEVKRLATPLPYEIIAKKIGCTVRNVTRKLLTRKKD
jgi:RIO-like serine/threonine protein kinase